MRQENYYLTSLDQIKKVSSRLLEIIPDGKIKVSFSDAGSKTVKQGNLWFMWCEDVSKAGIGGEHEETKMGTHLVAKYRFVLPILERKDSKFADLWAAWYERHQYDREELEYFVDHHVSITRLDKSEMAIALTDFKNYYSIKLGVNLREPEFRGLLDEK